MPDNVNVPAGLPKTVRQKANLVKQWVLEGANREWIRQFQKDHPGEFFRGMIQSLPKDVDIEVGQNLIEVIRHLSDEELKK